MTTEYPAVNEGEGTPEQNSPAVETNLPETEVAESAEKPEQTPETEDKGETPATPQDKNWREARKKMEELEKENAELRAKFTKPELRKSVGNVNALYLTDSENMELRLNEFKAEQAFPEINNNKIFGSAVAGAYREALDEYTLAKSMGKPAQMPDVFSIAKSVKAEYDGQFGTVSKKAEEEGAKKAKQAVASREATADVETGSNVRAKVLREENEEALRQQIKRGGQSGIEALARLLEKRG